MRIPLSLHILLTNFTSDVVLWMINSKGDVPYLIAEPTLAEKELGFSAPQDLDTMCRDLWNWQLRNPQGLDGPFISGDLAQIAAKAPLSNGVDKK